MTKTHVMKLKEKYREEYKAFAKLLWEEAKIKKSPYMGSKEVALKQTCKELLEDFYPIKNELSLSGYKRPMSKEESDFYSFMHRQLDIIIETLVEGAK